MCSQYFGKIIMNGEEVTRWTETVVTSSRHCGNHLNRFMETMSILQDNIQFDWQI
jgi:hypothetical protein